MIRIGNKLRQILLLSFMLVFMFSTIIPTMGAYSGAIAEAAAEDTISVADFSDLKGHWAEEQLNEWIAHGLIQGYPDGTIQPDRLINRGETFAFVNRALGFSAQSFIHFLDLSPSDWEYKDVAKAVKAGYIEGYPDGTIRTKQSISRQETAIIIARLLNLDMNQSDEVLGDFIDADQIPIWSRGAVIAVINAGLMNGYEDGSFKADSPVTRAEIVVALDRSMNWLEEVTDGDPDPFDTRIESVTAVNGKVVVELNTSKEPLIGEFEVKQIINNTAATIVIPSAMAWDASMNTATLTVPLVNEGNMEQSVVYRISYNGAVAIDSPAFVLPIAQESPIIQPALMIHSVSAQNGLVNVEFNRSLSKTPNIEDFIVMQLINDENAEVVNLGQIEWNSDLRTAKLTVPIIPVEDERQSVIYRVSYKGGASVESMPFIMEGDNNTVAIVQDGEAKAIIIADESIISMEGKDVPYWYTWSNDPEHDPRGSAGLTENVARTGHLSLRLSNMIDGRIYQSVSIEPGPITAQFYVYAPDGGNGEIAIGMNFIDKSNNTEGDIIGELFFRSDFTSFSDAMDGWKLITVHGVIPDKVNDSVVTRGQLFFHVSGAEGQSVYIDDINVIQGVEGNNIAKNPNFEQMSNIAAELAEYVEKSTGVELPIVTNAPSGYEGIKIYIGGGRIEDEARHLDLMQGLNEHGFIIDTQSDSITIVGPTAKATQFGVYEFLERYVGVRWLMPGPDGEDVPTLEAIEVPRGLIREQPVTMGRDLFVMTTQDTVDWAEKNRIYRTFEFSHNMNNLFDPKVFSDHPEYYSGGVVPDHPSNWNPCFNDATANAAIGRIIQYFDENPDKTSYSLGINDSVSFCETPNGVNSTGEPNMSDIYYPWVNKVVEGVLSVYDDKYFGLLAYWATYDPPINADGTPYKLHPHVIPYITDERLTWLDESIGEIGDQHTKNG